MTPSILRSARMGITLAPHFPDRVATMLEIGVFPSGLAGLGGLLHVLRAHAPLIPSAEWEADDRSIGKE